MSANLHLVPVAENSTNVRFTTPGLPSAAPGARPPGENRPPASHETVVTREHLGIDQRCAQCGHALVETWADAPGLCLRCGLEAELFDREARWTRFYGASARRP